jgi:hypothetical protein
MTLKDLIGSVRTLMAERNAPDKATQNGTVWTAGPGTKYAPIKDVAAMERARQVYLEPPVTWNGQPLILCPFCLKSGESKTNSILALREHIELNHFPRHCSVCLRTKESHMLTLDSPSIRKACGDGFFVVTTEEGKKGWIEEHKCVICGDFWLSGLPVKDNEACRKCQEVRR